MTLRLFALLLLLAFAGNVHAQDNRGLEIGTTTSISIDKDYFSKTKNVALIIGTDDYENWPHLSNPVFDAETMRDELKKDYQYDVIFLKNPTKKQILDNLGNLYKQFNNGTYGTNSNLLIFIAGHGGYDNFVTGYIVTTDAKSSANDEFKETCIKHDELRSMADNIRSQHTLVLLDVCYGGTFDERISNGGHRGDNDEYAMIDYSELLSRKMPKHSRKYITSGGKEYVPDGRPGHHSPFAYQLITLLNESYDNKRAVTFHKLCSGLEFLKPEPCAGEFGTNDPGSDFILLPYSLTSQGQGAGGNKPVAIAGQFKKEVAAPPPGETSYPSGATTPGIDKKDSPYYIEMVPVPGGAFNMGGNVENDGKPIHRVTISGFKMGRYDITQAQWKAVMGSNPSYHKDCYQCPVENVSWDDAQLFIKKLNALTGKQYRLPTEAEWEYAARGGSQSRGYTYAGSNSIDDVAWHDSNSGGASHPVGGKKANELGLYDMAGNVWQWCVDRYGAYSAGEQSDPKGPEAGSYRVLRGGSWFDAAVGCRSAGRYSINPGNLNDCIGFRLASPQ